ncbi:bifunctional phosphopantothenoylcysteine decarboxylase/phosphopantothenate--cysteine ligase CoaBC [Schleiferiaceae bacterium]|nr:bifunctional phosphopantothenoylcysteine decarboxylase/phosphopantothenate--cysteine ligase CoaBC [Schleiferiaceae bacterium]
MYKRKVLLGVSGSIAAYKSAHLVRELIKWGAEVQVVMTTAAKDFITPLTLSTLSTRPVYSTFLKEEEEQYGVWNNHVDLGLWADLMLIAPTSSNTLSKLVTGACDDLLSAVYMSAKCPVYVAPAMDLDMYKNAATASNIEVLESRGVVVLPAEHGELASGLIGQGRMAEPEAICEFITSHLLKHLPLYGKNVLINAGPTHEHIDPVRYIGNNSTGQMGVALAQASKALGATVTLVLGPTHHPLDLKGLQVIRVVSAKEMLTAMQEYYPSSVLTICTAAVSDFAPVDAEDKKLKKTSMTGTMSLQLEQTPDILAALGAAKKPNQKLVGFALETNNGEEYAKEKLVRKNADAIILNMLSSKTAFESNTNAVDIFFQDGGELSFELMDKSLLGKQLLEALMEKFQ